MFIILMISIDTSQAISAAAGPGVMIVDTHVAQEVEEYELVVQNTDTSPLRVNFIVEGDINNTDIVDIEFGDNDFILQPNRKRIIPVAFSVKTAGTYHGKILSSFSGVQELDGTTGAGVGFAATTKVTINARGEHSEGRVTDNNHNFSIALQKPIPTYTHVVTEKPDTSSNKGEKAPLTICPFLTGFASALLLAFRKKEQSNNGGENK